MISLKNRKIALIGGAGFIGHNLALALKSQGAEVFVIDSLQVNNLLSFTSNTDDITNRKLYWEILNQRLELLRDAAIELNVQDARDYSALSRILDMFKPQVIIQLAAVAHAGRSNKDPHSTFDHSLRTLENALDFARQSVEHFIYFSSSMVYGNFETDTVDEETPCNPIGIYGALKLAGEKIVIAYNQVFDLPYTIVRPSALYGERCVSRRVGQIFIEKALENTEISLHGDGLDRLDFTYIQDLVNGIIDVIENENSKNQTFNLTYGHSRTLVDMVNVLNTYFPKAKVQYLPKDKLTPSRGTLSVDKAKDLLGYNPQFPLEKGYARYIEWYQSLRE
ncbi:NAD(P)-dependent oxidoreductase [Deltaproteobacteria bacterium TL4]